MTKRLICIILGTCVMTVATSCASNNALNLPSYTPQYNSHNSGYINNSDAFPPMSEYPRPVNPDRTEPNPALDFFYEIDGDNVTITKYVGDDGDVVIPEKVIGKSVTTIGNEAFMSCFHLTTVKIPNSVTIIGDGVFYNCFFLASVAMSENVKSIGDFAFGMCQFLTDITIPNGITKIGNGVFDNCQILQNITIPNGVKSIGRGAFAYCYSLANITIPSSVTSIDDGAFAYCRFLTSIAIPNSVTKMGYKVFANCSELDEWTGFDCFAVVITCSRNSYAHMYCTKNNIEVQFI